MFVLIKTQTGKVRLHTTSCKLLSSGWKGGDHFPKAACYSGGEEQKAWGVICTRGFSWVPRAGCAGAPSRYGATSPAVSCVKPWVPSSWARKYWYQFPTCIFVRASPVSHQACSEAQPTGWLSTQGTFRRGSDWQGHDVLSGRLCFRNKIALRNCNGIAPSERLLNWQCLSNTGMLTLLCPFCVLFFIYASPGETEKLLLIPGPCFSSLSPLSLSFTTEISQQCQEAGMPWEGKNSLQWQRSLLLLLVCLQLSRQRIHERGKSRGISAARARQI